ncbi:MAG: DUF2783 domain-containing protein [Hyphomicrobiaceae bacterium]
MTDPTTRLVTAENFSGKGDDFYAALIAAHEGLSDTDSHRLNTRLVLLLANQVGDLDVLKAVLARARQGL